MVATTGAKATNKQLMLFCLFIIGAMSYVDRTIVSILQVPIKKELGLSDTQLGTLTGLSFALVYVSMAVPISRLADRSNRTWVILAALAIWSAMTAASGFAGSFIVLIILRTGVGFGEAGSVPATHSIIADLFPTEQRGRALGTWGLCLPAGMIVGLVGAGWIADNMGWRAAFWLIGGVGLVIAFIFLFIMREPERGRFDPVETKQEATPPLGASLMTLWKLKSYRYMALAGSAHAFVQYSLMNWNAPFYTRVMGMSLHDTANAMALLSGVGGAIGMWGGGYLCDKLGHDDVRWQMRIPAIASALLLPLGFAQYLVTSPTLSIAIGLVCSALVVAYFAPIVAVPMLVVNARLRAFASATNLVIFNLVGLGLGPLATGIISDILVNRFDFGDQSLRFALPIVMLPLIIASFLFWRSSRHLPAERLGAAQPPSAIVEPMPELVKA